MSIIEIILIAFSLALDVAVVSVGAGALSRLTVRQSLLVAFCFGLFHALMPLVGWYAGYWSEGYLIEYGKLIGFALILIVGLRMLKGALEPPDVERERNILKPKVLLLLAFATSIDALAIGFTFTFLTVPVFLAVLIIGGVTFGMSLLGVYIGERNKHVAGNKIELVGAAVLILLAFKVLLF